MEGHPLQQLVKEVGGRRRCGPTIDAQHIPAADIVPRREVPVDLAEACPADICRVSLDQITRKPWQVIFGTEINRFRSSSGKVRMNSADGWLPSLRPSVHQVHPRSQPCRERFRRVISALNTPSEGVSVVGWATRLCAGLTVSRRQNYTRKRKESRWTRFGNARPAFAASAGN